MVRLKVTKAGERINFEDGFNSKVVRLKVIGVYLSLVNVESFNSKVVRLKAKSLYLSSLLKCPFQFQSGAVKRFDIEKAAKPKFSFNSKVVRLKVPQNFENPRTLLRFNSKVVRLKAVGASRSSLYVCMVSIPKWCG